MKLYTQIWWLWWIMGGVFATIGMIISIEVLNTPFWFCWILPCSLQLLCYGLAYQLSERIEK